MDQTFKRLFINDNGPKQFFILSLLALAGAVGVHWAVGGGGEMKSLLCFGKARKRQAIEADVENLESLPSWTAPDNTLMMQAFEWYVPPDGRHWYRLQRILPDLREIGVDHIWIPPGCKAMSPRGNGYDIYDLYDLGEFDQKGSVPTKWGTRRELENMLLTARQQGIGVIWDAVLNHKAAADYTERVTAVKVDPKDRTKEISKPQEIEAWVGYNFPGRGEKYSSMKYNWEHFTGIDYNALDGKSAIYKFMGPNKTWATDVSEELGNYDYLMFADLDYSHPEVQKDVLNWVKWLSGQLQLSGIRLDAVKHYSYGFQKKLVDYIRQEINPNWFIVAEFWSAEYKELLGYLSSMGESVALFDAALVANFSTASRSDVADLRLIFEGTLVKYKPQHAVTFVMNHDTQPSQSLEAPITPYFKPLAYALILLRNEGTPFLFYGDLYGMRGGGGEKRPACAGRLPSLALARKLYAYGEQRDYFDRRTCIGFVRYGNKRHPSGLACVLSNGAASRKTMFVGRHHAGERWTDLLGWNQEVVTIDSRGWATFPVSVRSVSVWVNAEAEGRDRFRHFNTDIYAY